MRFTSQQTPAWLVCKRYKFLKRWKFIVDPPLDSVLSVSQSRPCASSFAPVPKGRSTTTMFKAGKGRCCTTNLAHSFIRPRIACTPAMSELSTSLLCKSNFRLQGKSWRSRRRWTSPTRCMSVLTQTRASSQGYRVCCCARKRWMRVDCVCNSFAKMGGRTLIHSHWRISTTMRSLASVCIPTFGLRTRDFAFKATEGSDRSEFRLGKFKCLTSRTHGSYIAAEWKSLLENSGISKAEREANPQVLFRQEFAQLGLCAGIAPYT